jgi:hypothetical protein
MTKTATNHEQAYFNWLYRHIGAVTDPNPSHSHFLLAEQLHNKTFEWFVPNDDNRARDGMRLRDDFADTGHAWGRSQFIFSACTMLEMFIALAKRMDYEITEYAHEDGVGRIFWHLMNNLELDGYTDEVYMSDPFASARVEAALERVNKRTYDYNGNGGIFPLREPRQDQRKTEIWYQCAAYILENTDIAE